MVKYLEIILLFSCLITKKYCEERDILFKGLRSPEIFMSWPNATVPFFIDPNHFDHEQAMAIMSALSTFAFKTCVRFAPVMVAPKENQHIMTFVNPQGIKRCKIINKGHSDYQPHLVNIGYECLQSPEIDMFIMRALGFPFEHNRLTRDIYIRVMTENIETSAIELFTKVAILPSVLQWLPYDIHSVMHFGQRDYSKNGHRTIIFKNQNVTQHRVGLTDTDLRKIHLVYGSECQKRDRSEKKELCQSYPVVRRKRETEPTVQKSLRVNPNITPPPALVGAMSERTTENTDENVAEKNEKEYITKTLHTLGIINETDALIHKVHKLLALALNNAREKYCNTSTNMLKVGINNILQVKPTNNSDTIGIFQVIANYANTIVNSALKNITAFCENYNDKYDNDRSGHDTGTTVSPKTDRRKREVTYAMGATNTTEDLEDKKSAIDKKTIKEKDVKTQSREEDEEQNGNTTPKHRSSDSKPKSGRKGAPRRYFNERRYKIKQPKKSSESEWKQSDVSLDKEKNEEEDNVEKEQDGEEIDKKKKEDEAEIASEIVKEVLTEGLGKLLETGAVQTKNETDELEESEEDATEGGAEKGLVLDYVPKKVSVETVESGDTIKHVEEADKEKTEEVETEESVAPEKRHKKKLEEQVFEVKVIKPPKKVLSSKNEDTETSQEDEDKIMKTHNSLPKTVVLSKINEDFYSDRRWPFGEVIYTIKKLPGYDLEDMRNRLAEINSILKKKTCVKLKEVDHKEARGYDDYLVLDNSPDYVTGKVGGKQNFGCIELFEGGQHMQHTAMMVMAMLGFYFEVSRHDRDKYIRVHNRHIRPDKLHHFEKLKEETTLNVPYDYKSAMHPSWQFWRKIGKTGISTVATYKEHDPDGSVMRALGQHPELLSDIDIIKINSVYGIECFKTKRNIKRSRHHKNRGEDN